MFRFYPFDPDSPTGNSFNFTVTVHTPDDGDSSYTGSVQTLPAGGSGTMSLAGGNTVVEGGDIAMTASFTDPAQGSLPPEEQGAGGMYILWGDGQLDGVDQIATANSFPNYTFDHQYAEAGQYTVQAITEYIEPPGEDGTPQPWPYLVHSQDMTIDVTDFTPTFTVRPSTRTPTTGDYVQLTPNFKDAAEDPSGNYQLGSDNQPLTWAVDWGDGYSAVGDSNFDSFDHAYTTAGNYQPTVTVTTDDGTYTASTSITVSNPPKNTVSVSGGGTAYDAGQSPASFTVTRTGDTRNPLTVDFSLNGSDGVGPYEVTDGTGTILDGSVTIPAGSSGASIVITPLEDGTPRWTQSVGITLSDSSDYNLGSVSTAEVYIVNDDLSLYLGNGSNNIILDGSSDGTQDPVSLTLNFPTEERDGATVTLVDNAPTKADVWLDSPSEGDTPIMGDVDGTFVSSYTFTEGSGSTLPRVLYVTAYAGSGSIGDMTFLESDSDAHTQIPGSPPASPQPTTNLTTQPSNGGTGLVAQIKMLNDPNNSGDLNHDISSYPNDVHPWLVGQLVQLQAYVSGPPAMITQQFVASLQYTWNVGGNVLFNYVATTNGAVPTDLQADNGVSDGSRVGTAQEVIQFFWVSIPANIDSGFDASTVSVHVTGLGIDSTPSTTFDVYEPTVSNASLAIGTANNPPSGPVYGLYSGVSTPNNQQVGMIETAQVDVPEQFQSGTFNFLQLWKHQTTFGQGNGSSLVTVDTNTETFLDIGWPQNQTVVYSPTHIPIQGDPFNAGDGWTTGGVHWYVDGPSDTTYGVSISSNQAFTDDIMFRPVGKDSQWVPLELGEWGFSLVADRVTGSYTFGPTTYDNQFELTSSEPVWQHVGTTAMKKAP